MDQSNLKTYQIRPAALLLFNVAMVVGGSLATIFAKMINQDVEIQVREDTLTGH